MNKVCVAASVTHTMPSSRLLAGNESCLCNRFPLNECLMKWHKDNEGKDGL